MRIKTHNSLLKRKFGLLTDPSKIRIPTTKLLINNLWLDSADQRTFPTFNPYTEQVITNVSQASLSDLKMASTAALSAFQEGPWSRTSANQRSKLLLKLSNLIEEHTEELAALESLNNGKTYSDALNGDLPMTVSLFRYYSGLAEKIHGKTVPIIGPLFCYTREEPVGVCGLITPWNYPLVLAAMKLGPALAAGCTTILKPAEQTPLSTLRLGELILEAGFPPGVVNILTGFGDIGQGLVESPQVDKISFTGSTSVGKKILGLNGRPNIKRVTLELGGKSANIILDGADIDEAVMQAHAGVFGNQGQSCNAGSRLFVHASVYDEFVEKSVKLAKERVLGNPFHSETTQGPQISKRQQNRVEEYVAKGREQGAKTLVGGCNFSGKGYFVNPTVFVDVEDEMVIAKEEIFGPVMSILKFESDEEVLRRANSSEYGLAAGVFGKDYQRVNALAKRLKAGSVYVNCYDVFQYGTPFGGFKDSGLGRELGKYALQPYLETKTVVFSE